MGNRAVITTEKNYHNWGVGIYLHWNGGRDSVEAFLKYCELKGYRSPSDDNYGWARLCQVIGNFFGGGSSVGIDTLGNLDCDNGDNGVYIIEGWEIVDRKHFSGHEQDSYSLAEMLEAIDEKQPEGEQLGDFLKSEPIEDVKSLQIGDKVMWIDWSGRMCESEVVGIGERDWVNGRDVRGIPYVDFYGTSPETNVNNYLVHYEYRKVVR